MDPSDPSHYERLAQDLKLDRNPVARVMHLWGYGSARGTLERSVVSALLSLQMVLRHQAVEKFSFAAVTARGQCLFPEDSCDSFLAALGGLLRTIPLELPEVESLWVDVEGEDVEVDARRVVAEVQGGGREREVAYRGEKRWVPILRRAVGTRRLGHAPMVVRRGLVLVTGGLGGLGRLLARFLIEQYESKVLLVGRTAVSGESSAEQERKEALLALESRSSFVRYVALDVCDPGAVQAAVAKAERDWSTPLSTAFHLAGHGNVRSHWEASERHRIREESLESLREMLRARVFGAKAVQQVLADRPESSYVAFSSVHGTFGGATLASYAAASSFLDTDTLAWAARHGRRGMCVGWSSWRETGMSRNAPESAGRLAEASGFRQIDPERGLRSLRVALEQGLSHVLIGVDATRPHVARRAEYSGKPSRELLLCHTGHAPASLLDQGPLVDRFGVRIPLRLVTVPRIPRTEEGDVDTVVLSAVALADPDRGGQREATTATQRALVDVFRKVLGVGRGVDVRDNFFDLGADSLRLVKAHALITHDLGVSLSLVDLFRHTTIEKLAAFLDHGVLGGAEREDAGREVAEQRLHRQERRRSRLRGKVNGTDEPRGDDED
jgi:NAD(P)-dependent dehydrogenase (short-subunit alcohol dehydrogenase family)/acyl carrier protein